jgi:surfactin synthase thioesterase subunit
MLKPGETPAGQIAFFGHSMGALLAFELALRFEKAGNPISALFVSACAAPGYMPRRQELLGSDLELLNLVKDVTGVNPEFLNNDQFATTILPTLRGLKAVAAYDSPTGAVSCPIHGLMAENDELATTELMAPWAQRTTAGFDLTVFPGDHFYINTNLPQLAQWVEERIVQRCAEA